MSTCIDFLPDSHTNTHGDDDDDDDDNDDGDDDDDDDDVAGLLGNSVFTVFLWFANSPKRTEKARRGRP